MRVMNWFKRLVVFAALLAPAAVEASDYVGEFGGWEVYEDDDYCSMALEYEGPGDTILIFAKYTDGGIFLQASNANWSVKEDQKYELTYHLDGIAYSGGNSIGTSGILRKGFLTSFEPDFEKHFGAGSSLRIYLEEKLVDQLSLDGTASALVRVNSCVRAVQNKLAAVQREKERWEHISEDPFAAVVPESKKNQPAVPRGNAGTWTTANDYPSRALREEVEGTTGFRVTVGSNGRVTDCTITTSSGDSSLDSATCANITRRARFTPATDESGNETTGEWASAVNWSIPR